MHGDQLILGPLLRHVDHTSATVWVETAGPARVTVRAAGSSWTAPTFAAHGHHYALVDVEGLDPGSVHEYTVDVDGEPVWPPSGSPYPPSRLATLDLSGRGPRLVFGSCRTTMPHDAAGNGAHGVDALRAYALRMARGGQERWPDLALFVGDQVYADESPEAMRQFIASRRSLDEPPGQELRDFEEYAHLYRLTWSDPTNRWLLSTLPTLMIFDDHDIRDDWNTSWTWRRQMASLPWWHDRIVGGLASYWVYQHIGNLSREARADDELWQRIAAATEPGLDVTDDLDALAARADAHPDSYRWSYAVDLGATRLVVVDSRAGRMLDPDRRSMLDDEHMDWLASKLEGDFDHHLVATSLPFLLQPGLHYLEAWDEAVADGAWGRRAAGLGERIRQRLDLEHWAAFHQGFRRVCAMVDDVARGHRGPAPATVTFLSGDVHHSYVAEVERTGGTRVLQLVCSPIRNSMPRGLRAVASAAARRPAIAATRALARAAKVAPSPVRWRVTDGPWFDNCVANLEVHGRSFRVVWESGVVDENGGGDDASADPTLRTVATYATD